MKILHKLFLLIAATSFAQNTTGRLLPVAADGMYKIPIPHEITSYSNGNYSDFRIYNSKNQEIPYAKLLRQTPDDRVCYDFKAFKIASKQSVAKKNTVLVVENPMAQITDVSLRIANIEVTKKFSLSGSDDGKNWYGIINQKTFTDVRSEVSFADYLTIALPLTSYKFLKFEFDDTKTLPVNVLEVGVNRSIPCPNHVAWDTIKGATIKIEELPGYKKTSIHVSFLKPEAINRISLDVASPKHFERNARVYVLGQRKQKRKMVTYEETLDNFVIFPNMIDHTFDFMAKEFFIEIENRDSPPLEITKVGFSQQRRYMVAELEKGESYTISTGMPDRSAPDYDFPKIMYSDNMKTDLPQTMIVSIRHFEKPSDLKSDDDNVPIWQKSWFLWACICLATAAVGYFTWSLVRDMK
ncbi:MAG: hypothetical protein EOO50_07210 [Flavobacterium sp.]|uniref:hypothetical protein n=1 Tax=Flavobacterium sp. TaxID=239 RepID=UPI00120E6614|nr:hypothetical protein [Flavobacterium sp.]RZJ67044.1 MAG: hypothetical protein EOO50_07210 [Flavobacterium sp.]